MTIKFKFLTFALCALFTINLLANETDTLAKEDFTETELIAIYQNYIDSIETTIEYQTDEVSLPGDFATVNVPEGYKYVNVADTKTILFDLWGNVPYSDEEKPLGMLVPANFAVNKDITYAIEMTYVDDGYVKDDEAKNINYDDLLKEIQKSTKESSIKMRELGYSGSELIGWAAPPYYDATNKKLHWAKELKFDDATENTLNYDVRILGRKGFVQLTAISNMSALTDVSTGIAPILESINFNEGYRYADFNPNLDKVAAYGIGGLIAGKVLLKTGILAKAGLLLAKSWKIILIALAGLGGVFGKLFRRKETE